MKPLTSLKRRYGDMESVPTNHYYRRRVHRGYVASRPTPVSILLTLRQLKTREHESLDETIILVRTTLLHVDLTNILS